MISIIIPTLNAQTSLHGLLAALGGQTLPCEIIVVDSSSSDQTVKIAESHGAKTLIIKSHDFDHGGTRNLGVSKSTGDILVFLTQDAFPEDRHFLEVLIKPLETPETAAAYGKQIPQEHAKPTEKFARMFN
jgi:rhamnosyltransferase